MGTRKIELHPDDAQMMTQIRAQLRQARLDAGVGANALALQLGRNRDFIVDLERGKNESPRMSSLQLWAGALDLRMEFAVAGLWLFAHNAGEMTALYAMSRIWGEDRNMRLWLVAALRQWRIKMGLDVGVVAPQLAIDGDTLRRWEFESHDPLLARAMWQARVTGTQVRVSLWRKEDWVFG